MSLIYTNNQLFTFSRPSTIIRKLDLDRALLTPSEMEVIEVLLSSYRRGRRVAVVSSDGIYVLRARKGASRRNAGPKGSTL